MNRTLKASVVVLYLVAMLTIGVGTAEKSHAAKIDKGYPPCLAEDGSTQRSCVWDARHRGNGEGRSFVKVGKRYTTVPHAWAHQAVHIWRVDHCTKIKPKVYACKGWRIKK